MYLHCIACLMGMCKRPVRAVERSVTLCWNREVSVSTYSQKPETHDSKDSSVRKICLHPSTTIYIN